ncbi:MAG TPA: NEW3 domain-containing protein [Pseudonocardiaceae bacterium]|nr:NEW3 domain-containing protein [Pseudonocardiaceae bacterium]
MHRRLLRTALTATIAATLALVGLGQGSAAADTSPQGSLLPPPPPHVGDYNGLAKTPPMGFNDWAGFGCDINQQLFTNTADQLVGLGLNKLGYNYVNIDDCWMQKTRDANGNLQVNTDLFPNGMKWLGDYLHNKGLKFGIYEDAGYQTCQGAAGSYGNFQTDADQYASWGVDYLKLDYCYQPLDKYPGKTPGQVAQIVYHDASQALLNTKRPMIFSESAPAYYCCSGADFTNIMSWIAQNGNLWRYGSDIADNWASVLENYAEDNTPGLAAYAGPGHWNDADMLEIGNGGLNLTEEQSQFDVWSELASPLLLSTTLSTLTPTELNVVKNKDVIAVDQDPLGAQGTVVQSGTGYDVLSRPLAGGDRAVVLFNKGDTAQTITTSAKTVGFNGNGIYGLKDLVSKQQTTSNGTISANVPPHGTVMYRISRHASPLAAPSVAVSVSGSDPATVTVADNGILPISNVSVGLTAPSGWTVSPAKKSLPTILPGHSASATFTVSAPPPPPGQATNTLTATASYRWLFTKGSVSGDQTRITNTPYDNLAQAYNNIAITDESNTTPGNFDGGGDSYSAQALATAGATPGATITSNGTSFAWPGVAAGTKDNVITDGQIIKLAGTGKSVAFLGSEAGATSAPVTITYTDGSTSTANLGFPNWCCEGTTAYGATPAITTDHRDTPTGPANYGNDYYVFYNTVPVDPGKTVATVTLPNAQEIHVFALSLAS